MDETHRNGAAVRLVLVDAADEVKTWVSWLAVSMGIELVDIEPPSDATGDAVQEVMRSSPAIVVVGLARGAGWALEVVEGVDLIDPGITSIVLGEPGGDLWQRAIRAGARDVIAPDIGEDELRLALERAVARAHSWPRGTTETDGDVRRGRVVTITSPKGGCGKTFLATNIAYALQSEARGRTVLIDYDLQFGDVAGALGLRPEYTVSHAVQAPADATSVKAFLTTHPSGLYALCAPLNPAEADILEPARLGTLIDTLRQQFDWVIIDSSAGISEANLVAIERSTDVVLMATTDLASISAMRKAVAVLDQIGMTAHRRWYVLNRANARVGLEQVDIERSLGLGVDTAIPSSRAVPIAMNQGIAVMEDDPRSPAARGVRELLQRLSPMIVDREPDGNRGWLQRMRS